MKSPGELEAGIDTSRVGPAPGQTGRMKVADLRISPRFSFRLGIDDMGVDVSTGHGSLDAVRFRHSLAGVLTVWRDPADHQWYVVDGHKRLECAKRSRIDSVNVLHLEAAGVAEARECAALLNLRRHHLQ